MRDRLGEQPVGDTINRQPKKVNSNMQNGFTANHWSDGHGNPTGGCSFGAGFAISWQNGPLGRGDGRKEPNGAFVEDIIAAARDRLAYYQNTQFQCSANARAMNYLTMAISELNERTKDREARGVEGTHEE